MRGKSLVRTKEPGMHSSGPRPKLQTGSPTVTSLPTLAGAAQLRRAWPRGELPLGWQWTPSCCPLGLLAAVFPLLKITSRSPLARVTGSEPWSKLHELGSRAGLNALPKEQRSFDTPLICSGVDQVLPWSVDIEP